MNRSKVIVVTDQRSSSQAPPVPSQAAHNTYPLIDTLGRPLRDLRISVTDRCNFRCSYCMPKEVFNSEHPFLPQSALLSFEEITSLARIFVSMGVQKIRITGGEPLLRKNLERLIKMLSELRTPSNEKLDLTLTTNASVLARKAQALKDAGLQRLTVSLDAIDDVVFRQMNDANYPVENVLEGLAQALKVGLGPIKVNMVVKRGTNDQQILPMARHFRGMPVVLRFIEYMDVGSTNGWRMDEVLPSAEVIRQIHAVYPLQALAANQPGETATRFRYQDGAGEVGVISSVTQAFCHDCNRARLSTEGQLFTCLFASRGHDLRSLLRSPQGYADAQILSAIEPIWSQRSDRYSQLRGLTPDPISEERRVEMHYIGG